MTAENTQEIERLRKEIDAVDREIVGCIVRPVKSYGLHDWLRVSVGTARENARFIEAFQAARKALGLI